MSTNAPTVRTIKLFPPPTPDHLLAMLDWVKELNGGTLPVRGVTDTAMDSLATDLAGVSIKESRGKIPEIVRSGVLDSDDLDEDALRLLIQDAGRMAISAGSEGDELGGKGKGEGKEKLEGKEKPEGKAEEVKMYISGDWRDWDEGEAMGDYWRGGAYLSCDGE